MQESVERPGEHKLDVDVRLGARVATVDGCVLIDASYVDEREREEAEEQQPISSMVIDIGSAIRRASENHAAAPPGSVKTGAAGVAGRGGVQQGGSLTMYHSSVRHLKVCEGNHCWRWVPDAALSKFWCSLTPREKSFVTHTHDENGRVTVKFTKEMASLDVKHRNCRAGMKARRNLGMVFMLDQHSLSIYREIFTVAVEQNLPLAINMHVIEEVDSVVQDFCAATTRRAQRLQGHVDPRDFPLGSDLWVQYCEREHVRLLWMSTMARVFEVRLLQLWEAREGAEAREAQRAASLEAAKELLALESESKEQTKKKSKNKKKKKAAAAEVCAGGNVAAAAAAGGYGAGVAATVAQAPAPAEEGGLPSDQEAAADAEDASEAAAAAAAAAVPAPPAALAASEVGDLDEEVGDAIDQEFMWRVREHMNARAEEARRAATGEQAPEDRSGAVIKALCQKLKAQLESRAAEGGCLGA